ncbi:MAG: mannonate dehydratase [Bacteroidetes bacterium]|nr:mannonate dehydratase [Bacteroidota bacterium]MDA1120459.1 mannonate dehydratase [Bacteroidota bacterium]
MKDTRRDFIKKGAALSALSTFSIPNIAKSRTPIPLEDAPIQLCMAYFFGFEKLKMEYSRQMGVTGAVGSASRFMAGLQEGNAWDLKVLRALKERYASEGLEWKVCEGTPPLDKTKLGLPGRDEELEKFIKLIKGLGEIDVNIICHNWMPVISWHRSKVDTLSRGGALVSSFKYDDVKDQPLTEFGDFSEEQMWDNMEYFLKAVIPEAEKAGVKLALHPDDPPVPKIRGIARIMRKADAFKKLIDLYPSPSNGLTLCQGTFATMGEDIPEVIRYFGKREKIFFVHFRDIKGTKWDFEEAFHDDGITDMHKAMQEYYNVGYKGPMRPDHVPTMANDSNEHPGYSTIGFIYALGYIKGLMEAVHKSQV